MGYPDGVELSLVSDDPDDRAVRIQHHEERFVFRLGCHVPIQTDYFFVLCLLKLATTASWDSRHFKWRPIILVPLPRSVIS